GRAKTRAAEQPGGRQPADRFGPRRAEWIARRLRPTNLKQRPKTPPVFPAPGPLRTAESPVRARGLPDRFVVMGYQAGERVLLEAGAPVKARPLVGAPLDDPPLPHAAPGAPPPHPPI